MEVQTADNKFQQIIYGDSLYEELKKHLSQNADKPQHHLSLFLGIYLPDKKKAVQEIADQLNHDVKIIDTENYVTKIESETFQGLDELFSNLQHEDTILYFKNGSKLCGSYTGNSLSRVKYATPQERYFIDKIQDFNGLIIVDIEEYTDADKSLRRAAQSIVSFNLPDSKLSRFMWHLKNFSPNGNDLKTSRPEAYSEFV